MALRSYSSRNTCRQAASNSSWRKLRRTTRPWMWRSVCLMLGILGITVQSQFSFHISSRIRDYVTGQSAQIWFPQRNLLHPANHRLFFWLFFIEYFPPGMNPSSAASCCALCFRPGRGGAPRFSLPSGTYCFSVQTSLLLRSQNIIINMNCWLAVICTPVTHRSSMATWHVTPSSSSTTASSRSAQVCSRQGLFCHYSHFYISDLCRRLHTK